MGGPTAWRGWAAGAALSLSLACVGPTDRTFVTGRIEPRQIRFVTLSKAPMGKPGGWQAACIHIRISRENTGESVLCKFGVEFPMHNNQGPVSRALAQRITADWINAASHTVFARARPESPLGMLCESLKAVLRPALQSSAEGARFSAVCNEMTTPVQFGAITL